MSAKLSLADMADFEQIAQNPTNEKFTPPYDDYEVVPAGIKAFTAKSGNDFMVVEFRIVRGRDTDEEFAGKTFGVLQNMTATWQAKSAIRFLATLKPVDVDMSPKGFCDAGGNIDIELFNEMCHEIFDNLLTQRLGYVISVEPGKDPDYPKYTVADAYERED